MINTSHQEKDQSITALKRLLSLETKGEHPADFGMVKSFFDLTVAHGVMSGRADTVCILLLFLADYAMHKLGVKKDGAASLSLREFLHTEVDQVTPESMEKILLQVAHLAGVLAADKVSGLPIDYRKGLATYDFRHDGHPMTREGAVHLHLVRSFESVSSSFGQMMYRLFGRLAPQGPVINAVAENWPILICDLTQKRHGLLASELMNLTRSKVLLITRNLTQVVRNSLPPRAAVVQDREGLVASIFGEKPESVFVVEPRIGGYTITSGVHVMFKPRTKNTRMLIAWKRAIESTSVPKWLRLLSAVRYPRGIALIDGSGHEVK